MHFMILKVILMYCKESLILDFTLFFTYIFSENNYIIYYKLSTYNPCYYLFFIYILYTPIILYTSYLSPFFIIITIF